MASLEDALEHVGAQLELMRSDEEKDRRTPSRWVGQAADPSYVRQLANDRSETRRTVSEHGATGQLGGTFLADLRSWSRGDSGAFGRLAKEAKSLDGGELLIPAEIVPGYLEAARSAAPARFLARRHEVRGREVHLLRELDTVTADWTGEGMTKPLSDAGIDEVVSLVYKAAALVALLDEQNADSNGVALEIVGRGMATAINRKIDATLLNGDGVNKPLGLLQVAAGVNQTPVSGSTAGDLFDELIAAIGRVRGHVVTVLVDIASEVFPTARRSSPLGVSSLPLFHQCSTAPQSRTRRALAPRPSAPLAGGR